MELFPDDTDAEWNSEISFDVAPPFPSRNLLAESEAKPSAVPSLLFLALQVLHKAKRRDDIVFINQNRKFNNIAVHEAFRMCKAYQTMIQYIALANQCGHVIGSYVASYIRKERMDADCFTISFNNKNQEHHFVDNLKRKYVVKEEPAESADLLSQDPRHLAESADLLSQDPRHLAEPADLLSQDPRRLTEPADLLSQDPRRLTEHVNSSLRIGTQSEPFWPTTHIIRAIQAEPFRPDMFKICHVYHRKYPLLHVKINLMQTRYVRAEFDIQTLHLVTGELSYQTLKLCNNKCRLDNVIQNIIKQRFVVLDATSAPMLRHPDPKKCISVNSPFGLHVAQQKFILEKAGWHCLNKPCANTDCIMNEAVQRKLYTKWFPETIVEQEATSSGIPLDAKPDASS